LPKLLGSYESELHPTICELSRIPFDTVVDIGCAEGYYAIGAARLWNNATVYAFDIDPDARTACSTMAVLNGVADRVRIAGKCDPACLLSLPLGQRSLIIADCEGYERSLFSGPVVADLYKSDFIVEMHDFIDIEISAELKERFSQTHWVKSVYSVDDLQKVHQYKYPALDGLSKDKTRAVLSERRPGIMEWLIARSRIGSQ
jgi:ribosomal protein L11 methylase PrmA